jgi:hypothetical protein
MSHIDSKYVKSYKEIKYEDNNKVLEKCIYCLHDGNHITIECEYEAEKKEDGSLYNWKDKMVKCDSYISDAEGKPTSDNGGIMKELTALENYLKA